MESQVEKKKARITGEDGGEEEDRISRLSDELLHKVLSFIDTKWAVQTSVLSRRWKLIWTTLPFLKFHQTINTGEVARQVLTKRNHQTPISSLELAYFPPELVAKFVKYAISRNVEYLNVELEYSGQPFPLSNFRSSSIRELKLGIEFDYNMSESDSWDLPSLTTLDWRALTCPPTRFLGLPEICLASLPALTTLRLERVRLEPLCLPHLTALELSVCILPDKVWNFPALKSLTLWNVVIPENVRNDIFSALVGLQNLTLSFFLVPVQAYVISCPQLLNLEIKTFSRSYETHNNTIMVLAPKLRNFTSVGVFPIACIDSKLDNVHIKLRGSTLDCRDTCAKLKGYSQQFPYMLAGLRNAKILNLDLQAFEALSLISDFLANFPSPFSNLKYVKLPHGLTETSMSSTLRSFLIDGSPTATIVTTLPQNNMIPQIAAAAVTAQNVVPQNPSAAPTKVLVDSENIKKTMCIDTVDMKVQDENVAQNSALAVNKARQISAPVERTGTDQASNSRGNSDFGLWHGHEINSEFVCLLDLIMNKYPETFEHFITKNKKFSTMKLNMLCSSVINLTKTSMSEVDTELIAECRDVFAVLQNFGFNVSWLVNHLNYIEKFRFSQPLTEIHAIDLRIKDAKTKLQDLQTLRSEKMQEIQKAFGTMGTNLVVGCIGDDLFSGWGSGRGGYTGAANTGRSQREGLMSYKLFIQELEDDILPAEAERRYQEYKSEYITTQKRAYFNAHKHEEWLKDKYHPTNLLAVIDRRNEHARKMAKDFLLELQSGTVDMNAVKCARCKGYCHTQCMVSSTPDMNKEVKFLETCKHCYESDLVTEENHDVANTSFLQFKETQNVLTETKDIPTSCLRTEKPQNTPTICEGGNKKDSVMNRALDHSSEKLSRKGSNLKSESRSRLCSWGLIWKKNSCKGNGFDFRLKNILMKGNPNFSDVRCDLCKKAYNKDFMYISCETCNKWYHADALELDESRLFDLLGFRCCKCRRIKSPTCPYTDPVKKPVSEGRNVRRSAPKQGSLGLDDQPVRIEGVNPFGSLSRAEHVTDDPTPEVNINSLPGSRNISVGRHLMQNTTMVSFPENNFSVGLSANLVENSLLPVVESSSCKGLNISRNDLDGVMSDIEDLNYEDMDFEPRNYISRSEFGTSDDGQKHFDGVELSMTITETLKKSSTLPSNGKFEEYGASTNQQECRDSLAPPVCIGQCRICYLAEPNPDRCCEICRQWMHSHCSPVEESSGLGPWRCVNCREWQ